MKNFSWFTSKFVTLLLLVCLIRMFSSGIRPEEPADLIAFEQKELEDINEACLDVHHCQQIIERNRYWLFRGSMSEDALEELLLNLESAESRVERTLRDARFRKWEK